MPHINIILTPTELNDIPEKHHTLVVIDTLRASTTIITALANGARGVMPFGTTVELKHFWERACTETRIKYLRCGERYGQAIKGFDLGNSPRDYQTSAVNNKIILLKTSNGTRVLRRLKPTNTILIGAMVNSQAVTRTVMALNRDLYLVCAGTQGAFSLEDFVTAGRFSCLLLNQGWQGDDLVLAAARIFEDNQQYEEVINLFLHSYNGQNLNHLGYYQDVEFAGKMDIFPVVPHLKGKIIVL